MDAPRREVTIRKTAQGLMLLAYTVFVLGVTLVVQGGESTRTNLAPFEDVARLAARAAQDGFRSNAVLYALAGIGGNLALFVLWGFLFWKFLNVPDRRPFRTGAEVVLAGFLFSSGIETVQLFLPTRAADVNDVFWNVLGTAAGALLAHAGRRVSLRWE